MPEGQGDKTVRRVNSCGDERVVNNVMRHEYRGLTDVEKTYVQAIKNLGLEFVVTLHAIGQTDAQEDRQGSRELSLAQTKVEEAVMWAVKHLTKG